MSVAITQHAMRDAADSCLVLLFYLSISARHNGMGSRSKIATQSVYAFEEAKDMRKCTVNGGKKDTEPL